MRKHFSQENYFNANQLCINDEHGRYQLYVAMQKARDKGC